MKVEITPRQLQILLSLVKQSTLDQAVKRLAARSAQETAFYEKTALEFNELERSLTRVLGGSDDGDDGDDGDGDDDDDDDDDDE